MADCGGRSRGGSGLTDAPVARDKLQASSAHDWPAWLSNWITRGQDRCVVRLDQGKGDRTSTCVQQRTRRLRPVLGSSTSSPPTRTQDCITRVLGTSPPQHCEEFHNQEFLSTKFCEGFLRPAKCRQNKLPASIGCPHRPSSPVESAVSPHDPHPATTAGYSVC